MPKRLVDSVSFLFVGALGLGAFLGGSAIAQSQENGTSTRQEKPKKPAWQWTVEERLAARFDPEGMKVRAAREAELARKTAARFGESFDISSDQHSIDGKREPELFLPGELFDALLSHAFHHSSLHQREMRPYIEERAAVLGFGSDLWVRLEKVAAPFLRLQGEQQLRVLAAAGHAQELKDSDHDNLMICRAQSKAFADAKAAFGEQAFLRLLYEAVAPTMSLGYQLKEGMADQLRFRERGCR